MQNFTLGKRGLPMLLFALILLTASFSSFAQENCPTVEDTTQDFCYLATVTDLQATANGDTVRWYRTAASTNPIPSNELLQTGTYHAGNASASCNNRVAVSVTIDDAGAPTTQFGNIFAPCEYDEDDVSTVQALINNVDGSIEEGETEKNEVEIFATEFGETAMDPTTRLIEGNSYFAGQINRSTGCRTSRIALRYDPVLAIAPTGEDFQQFCVGATVADLEATFTSLDGQAIRWYSTPSSSPALDSTTPLVDGEKYYASQIVNRNNSNLPPCESTDRFEVTVSLEGGEITENTQRFCESIGVGNDFDRPRVKNLVSQFENPVWFADADFTIELDPETLLENDEDYFTSDSANCQIEQVNVELFDTPNAGSTTTVPVCSNDEPFNLVNEINDSQLGAPQQTGRFSPELSTGTLIFDPADYEPGRHTFRYIVEGNEDCPTDDTVVYVDIEAAPIAGADISETICSSEINNAIELAQEYVSYLENRDLTGTFDNNATPEVETFTLEQLAGAIAGQYQTSPFLPFSYTYTVGGENGCQDSAQINLTIFESPYAGEDAIVNLSAEGTDPINLFDRLGGTPDGPGNWSNGDGIFDPETDAPGVFTYTVTSSNGCVDTATVTVQGDCPVTITDTQRFCESIGEGNDFDRPRVRNLESTLDSPTWFADEALTQELAPETLLVDGEEYFSSDSRECVIERVIVDLFDTPNAGSTTTVTVCSNDEPFDLVARINPSIIGAPDTNGTFIPALVSGTNVFDPSLDVARQYTYRVEGNDDCPTDTSFITVNIISASNAGENGSVELSREGNPVNLFTYLNGNPDEGGTWTPGNSNGSFDPAKDEAGVYTYTLTNGNCESSATVTVTLTNDEIICPIVTDSEQAFCQSIGEGNNFRRPTVSDLLPSNAIWYATADAEEPLAANTVLIDGEDYFAGNEDGTCTTRGRVVVILDDSPNAGATTNITVCATDAPFDLLSRMNPSILGAPDAGGTFTPALASGTTIFDPSVDAARQYTYTVQSTNDACPDDEARITVNITEPTNANAGEDVEGTYCSNDGIIDLYSLIADGVNMNGVFEGFENGQFDTSVNIGENEITYTVDDEEGCVIAGSATYSITVFEAPNAGPGADLNYCITDIQEMSTQEAIAIFENLIPDDVTDGGEFSTSINALIIQFTGNPIGEFSTTYTVVNENCTDSATYTVTISEAVAADAGSDVDDLVFCSTATDVNLNNFLSDDALQNGYFEDLENGVFSPSTVGVGTFTFTFTVDSSSDCVTGSDSAIYTIEVLQGPDAGENGNVTLRTSDDPVNLFSYLNGTPDAEGTWNPGNVNGEFDPSQYEEGQFVFTYTVVSENECEASATVTVTITDDEIICPIVTDTEQAFCESIGEGNDSRLPRVSDLLPANATWYATATSDTPLASTTILIDGEDYFAGNPDGNCPTRGRVVVTLDDSPNAGGTTNITVCSDDAPFDLLGRMNPSILGAPDTGGTFTPALASGTTIFDPSRDAARQYTYTVESTNEACPNDDTRVTVNIIQSEVANAGDNISLDFCIDDADVNLYDYLADDVTTSGSFEGYANGTFSPSTLGVNTYTITYSIGDDLQCITGTDSATITITVNDRAEAPVATATQIFCEVENATVADLAATGEGLVWYLDADLETEADPTTALLDGAVYYVASVTGTSVCEKSEGVMVTVSIDDAVSPTIQPEGNEFCRSDNPTVQDLIDNLNGDGIRIYSSATGGTPLATSAALQNGVAYYATATNANGCESSERRLIAVEVGFCGIPEGFSPNGDNINDRFVIPDIAEDYPNYTIEIFNRWGNVVFKGNARTPDWDGVSNQSTTLGDKVLPAGVYFYILNYNDGQTTPVQGKLYLSR
ncbi:MAG: gliding motility-associated C-terminal domain-containing protein [Gillisia sp.]